MKVSAEMERSYSIIELGILIQRSIEILDDLNVENHPFKNKKLNAQLKGVYGVLDKETKLYNEMHKVSEVDTYHFYDVIKENAKFIMNHNLADKSLICSFLTAHDKDKKSVEGILNKILRS